MNLWTANLAPGATAEKVEQLLQKYGSKPASRMVRAPAERRPKGSIRESHAKSNVFLTPLLVHVAAGISLIGVGSSRHPRAA